MSSRTDVVICGSGSAGLCAAAWLARCGLRCIVLESAPGPLQVGKADGVQCRTVEIFESFGLSDELLRESYHVNEVCFWKAAAAEGPEGDIRGIVRTGRTADTPKGLSHMPHVILNQARINSMLIAAMKRWNGQEITYNWTVKNVMVDEVKNAEGTSEAYPVGVTATHENGQEHEWRAKYVLGCDGAHSAVRKALGFRMLGDGTDSVWGVMDVYPQTTFPDIRKKVAIQSAYGSLLIIPREGDSLVRLYVELKAGTVAKEVRLEHLIAWAQRVFVPYSFEVVETLWWSAYSIGQRLADQCTKANRVFLTGDACHTHSPKAGQGMNVSLQDGHNIGWKLAHVLKGQASPDLLRTYELERGKVAADLIAFDREFVKRFSDKNEVHIPASGATGNESRIVEATVSVEPENLAFRDYFLKASRYTAGLTAIYGDSPITSTATSRQDLAKAVKVGMRFPSAQVVRASDSLTMQLMRALPSDGKWHIVLFGGKTDAAGEIYKRLGKIAEGLEDTIKIVTRENSNPNEILGMVVILQGDMNTIDVAEIPEFFRPVNGKWKIRDPHKIYLDCESHNHGHGHAYETYGVDPVNGALVIVRPDQYVSMVCEPENTEAVARLFRGWFSPAQTYTIQ